MVERPILFAAPMVRAILAGAKTQTRRLIDADNMKVRLPYEVRSDLPTFALGPGEKLLVAKPGVHKARMAGAGAVVVLLDGKPLGVKPGEFDFGCPYLSGTTRLHDGKWRIEPNGKQLLWVRESCWIAPPRFGDEPADAPRDNEGRRRVVGYDASMDGESRRCATDYAVKKTPSIHMPRWASRLTLDVIGVRIERLQDITDADIFAEGVTIELAAERTGTSLSAIPTLRDAWRLCWDSINGKRADWKSNPWVWVVEFKRVEGVR